jgi:PKD repeat protein
MITATAAPSNQAPVAVAGANVTSGVAPLAVNFSSQGSYDPDGTIASYVWNFGDGTSSTLANPSHPYSTAGNFAATLTVTDNSGATSSSSVSISVQQAQTVAIYVQSITMSLVTSGGKTSGRAVITVYDANGVPRPNVTVTGKWSGLATDSDSGVTNANGQVTFTSNSVNSRKTGTFTLSVTGLSASGYTYDPSRNVVSSGSVSK